MFKISKGLILASLFIVGCSKTNPNIELKEKVIEKNLRTYDALTASQDMQLSDETDLDLIINNIRSKRQINFDWKTFWIKTAENITPVKLSESTSFKLFSISKLSCEEAPNTSYLILQYAQKGLEQEMKVEGQKASHWFSHFQTVVLDCHLSEENAFIFRYKDILKDILVKGDKKLKKLALFDLDLRMSSTKNSLFIREVRELISSDKNLLNITGPSFNELTLLAHMFKTLFPLQPNPYLEVILDGDDFTASNLDEDLGEALIMLSRIDIPKKKLPHLTNTLIDLLEKNRVELSSLSNEEKVNHFNKQYALAENLISFLETELLNTKDRINVLNKVEKVIRNLEVSLFALSHPEEMILNRGYEDINLILDLRYAKKKGRSLSLESAPLEEIKRISDVLHVFHRMHQQGDVSSQIKLFCDWVKMIKTDSLNKQEINNGCYEITSKIAQKFKVESESFKTPLFSVIKYSGDLEIKAKKVDLGVIDLSQTKIPEPSSRLYSRELEAIVFPLVLGFELSEEFLGVKKDKLYFFPYQFVYRQALPGMDHFESSPNGLNGGNLILKIVKRSESFQPTFISNGGEPAQALAGNVGGKAVSYSMDLFKIEDWLASSSEGEVYPLEMLSAKNLKTLFSKIKKNHQYQTLIKLEPGFINHLGDEAASVFDESLKLARETGVLTSSNYLEELSSLAMNSLLEEIEFRISEGESLSRLSTLDVSLSLPSGSMSKKQALGQPGAKGVVIYE